MVQEFDTPEAAGGAFVDTPAQRPALLAIEDDGTERQLTEEEMERFRDGFADRRRDDAADRDADDEDAS